MTIAWDTFIKYVKDVCCSLAHHGFERILIVNGHGSNTSPIDMAARLSILEYEGKILCASVNHWDLRRARDVGNELRDSDYGGTSHGDFPPRCSNDDPSRPCADCSLAET